MLHIRLRVDGKCPRHPNRTYRQAPPGCCVCQAFWDAAEYVRRAERELRTAERFRGELRWRNVGRPVRAGGPSHLAGAQPEAAKNQVAVGAEAQG
jgi:hypothetical protein